VVKVGYIRRAHGVRGAVVVRSLSDDPERFAIGARFRTDSSTHPVLTVASVQPHKDGLLIAFDGLEDRDQAEALRGTSLLISADQRRELSADEFWADQLEGLTVVGVDGHSYGIVVAVVTGQAQDRLQVEGEDGTFDVPFVDALVPRVDLEAQQIVVDLPDGLAP
jgi:16S rRNA processing protein RimM